MKTGQEKTETQQQAGKNLNIQHLRTTHLQVAVSFPVYIPCSSSSHSSLKAERLLFQCFHSSLYRIFTWEREQQIHFLRGRKCGKASQTHVDGMRPTFYLLRHEAPLWGEHTVPLGEKGISVTLRLILLVLL